jgi:type IV secretory pathway VirB2 component (pilin)
MSLISLAVASFTGATSKPQALMAATDWIATLLFGSVGTSIAIIAVACLGFAMFTGRLPLRRAGQIILGCFIFFGARTISDSILTANQTSDVIASPTRSNPAPVIYPTVSPKIEAGVSAYDPYAGAALNPKQ